MSAEQFGRRSSWPQPSAADGGPDVARAPGVGRRKLRAVFAADVAGFSGRVSADETNALRALSTVRRVALHQLARYQGWLFGMPGDGLFALFESAMDAALCAMEMQTLLSTPETAKRAGGMRLRIGLHAGEVLFEDGAPFGEALAVAARLEALAEPGGVLVSGAVHDAIAPRIAARFVDRGAPALKNIPRRIPTYAMLPAAAPPRPEPSVEAAPPSQRPPRRAPSPPKRAITPPAGPASPTPQGAASQAAQQSAPPRAPQAPQPAAGSARTQPSRPGRKQPPSPPPASPLDDTIHAAPRPTKGAAPPVQPAWPAAPSIGARPATPERVAALGELLAAHLGPIARRLAPQAAIGARDLDDVIERLAAQLPSDAERAAFRARARQTL